MNLKLEATPLTTESLFEELHPFVSVIVDFPDGSERVVKVRRINNAEAFSGIGVYAIIQDDEKTLTKDEKVDLDIIIKRQSVVFSVVDSEAHNPMFKHSDSSSGADNAVSAYGIRS